MGRPRRGKQRYNDNRRSTVRTGRPFRPAPKHHHIKVDDRLVDKCFAFVRAVEADGRLPQLCAKRGPQGIRPRTLLTLLLLTACVTRSAELATAWEIGFLRLSPRARALLDIPDISVLSPRDERSSSTRVYRCWHRLVEHFDPVARAGAPGYDRRRRASLQQAGEWKKVWDSREAVQLRDQLEELCQALIAAPVLQAMSKNGTIGAWNGDAGVDATCVPVQSHPDSRRRELASGEYLAGWYATGGSNPEFIWGYSFTAVFTAAPGAAAGTFPQLCIGGVLHQPSKDIGGSATRSLHRVREAEMPPGQLAGDRAYTNCKPEDFQQPVRQLGYELILDFRSDQFGRQGQTRGAIWVDGSLGCPHMPTRLIDAGTQLRAARDSKDPDKTAKAEQLVKARPAYFLHLKQSADANGTVRLGCPAASKCPTVSCPRRPDGRPREVFIGVGRPRRRQLLPTVEAPAQPREEWPDVCTRDSISVRANENAKLRLPVTWMSPEWKLAFGTIRNLNEGGNSMIKRSFAASVADPQARLARGFVAQSVLTAVLLCANNMAELRRYHREHPPEGHPANKTTEPMPPTVDGPHADDLHASRLVPD